VLLVVVGMGVALLSRISLFSFVDDFVLTPEVLLYVFLPILLFESAYNIKYREIMRNAYSIGLLSVVSLVISSVVIGAALYWLLAVLGMPVPFIVTLLFGSLISATDPVAVLALFKELGAPPRLTLIFEGESLFNDGTALALFLVVLGFALQQGVVDPAESRHALNLFDRAFAALAAPEGAAALLKGALSFLLMIGVGILFGGLCGLFFSKVIARLENVEFVEITLTLILAHATFIFSEILNHYVLPVSGVIATTVAAMVVGNYGRYKISPRIEETMERFWAFIAFITNSMVFTMIGILIVSLGVKWQVMAVPIVLAIVVVMIARALSVYSVIVPLNALKLEEHIPRTWSHLLSWGSLRGSLAIIMVLLIPESLAFEGWSLGVSVKEFVLGLTVGCILFTLFGKATSIGAMMKRFRVGQPDEVEQFASLEGRMAMLVQVLGKTQAIHDLNYINEDAFRSLSARHEAELKRIVAEFEAFKGARHGRIDELIRRALLQQALGIEKYWLRHMLRYNEITERVFKTLMNGVEAQLYRAERGATGFWHLERRRQVGKDRLQRMVDFFGRYLNPDPHPELTEFHEERARQVLFDKVLKGLEIFRSIGFVAPSPAYAELVTHYEAMQRQALEHKQRLFEARPEAIFAFDTHLVEKSLLRTAEETLDEFYEKDLLSARVYGEIRETLQDRMLQPHAPLAAGG
jgi:CPA1 family monovalent cation:H+ antiporter